jgi:hypothetical protein
VENFLIVQYVRLRSAQRAKKSAQIRSLSALFTVKPHGSMTALRSAPRSFRLGRCGEISRVTQTNGKPAVGKPAVGKPTRRRTRRSFFQETGAENERPVRGDNRTGQAIWALGVDGRSRRIQPMGRDYRSHIDKSQHPRRTFKTPGDFFNFVFGNDCRKNRCAAGYFAAFAADLSDAIDG